MLAKYHRLVGVAKWLRTLLTAQKILGLIAGPVKIGHCHQRLATATTFLCRPDVMQR